jgi:aminoglycoside phosphotransferase (APT) family kinase protein
MNAVATYLTAHRERLGLARLGVAEPPCCVLVTPRFRASRHVIVLVLASGRRDPVLVAKLPRLPGAGAGLAREAANLRAAGSALADVDAGTAPALVAFEPAPAYPLLLETALPGRSLSPRVVRRDRERVVADGAAWLSRLARATARRPRDDGWYERLVAAPLRALSGRTANGTPLRPMVQRTLEQAEALRGADLPLVLEHGDLGHPNLLRQPDGRLGVLDWERADPAGLPGHDLFFFLAYAAVSGRAGTDGVPAAFFGRDAWAWPVAERYAADLGIDAGLLPSLLALASARVVAETGPPNGSTPAPGARDAAARHLVLWRRALEMA